MNNEQEDSSLQETDDTELELDVSETVEKPKKKEYSTEEKLARVNRMKARYEKELGVETPSKSEDKSAKKESDELDYGQKAYLRSYEIKGSDELALVRSELKRSGSTLDDLVENPYFQSKLRDLRDARLSAEAVSTAAKAGRRLAPGDKRSVDYWLLKPFAEVPDDMKREVLNAKVKQQRDGNKFSSNPVVTSIG